MTDEEVKVLRTALEVAHHELTTLHGLIAADGAAPNMTWNIDTRFAIDKIDDALRVLRDASVFLRSGEVGRVKT